MENLYDQVRCYPGKLLHDDIHQLIATARVSMNEQLIERVYEQRLYAEQAITRSSMKGFKARLRQDKVLV